MYRILAATGYAALYCVALNAAIWLFTARWFDWLWWVHLASIHLFYYFYHNYRIFNFCKAVNEEFISGCLRFWPGGSAERLRLLAFFGIALNCTELAVSSACFAYGMYLSALSYREGMAVEAYLESLAGILASALMLLPAEWLRIVQVKLERKFDGVPSGLYMPRTGEFMLKVGNLCWIPALIMWGIGLYVIISAFWWSDSSDDIKAACYVFVAIVAFSSLFWAFTDIGRRLCVPPVLVPDEVDWTHPAGLVLRSFRDEEMQYGEARENRVLVEMFLGTFILPEVKQWFTVSRPGEQLVFPGVQRVALSDDAWQDWVCDAIRRSDLIAVFIGDSGGLQWEMEQVFSHSETIKKLRVVILPDDPPSERKFFFDTVQELNGDLIIPQLKALNQQILVCKWESETPELEPVDFGSGVRADFVRASVAARAKWFD